jgi:hypothetical protein
MSGGKGNHDDKGEGRKEKRKEGRKEGINLCTS